MPVPNDQSLDEALRNIEEAMPRFARWLYSRVHPHLGHRVLDAGAGLGTYTDMLLKDGHEVVALEYNQPFANHLQKRFGGNPAIWISQADLGNP
ncbi:MAG: rRNA adenine N-6-methyltransferase family protein, partial [Chloroflexota bacterium]